MGESWILLVLLLVNPGIRLRIKLRRTSGRKGEWETGGLRISDSGFRIFTHHVIISPSVPLTVGCIEGRTQIIINKRELSRYGKHFPLSACGQG